MRTQVRSRRGVAALVAAASLLQAYVAPIIQAQTATTAGTGAKAAPVQAPAAAVKAAPAATAAKPIEPDGGWPRDYATAGGAIRIFQPQVSSWDGQKKIVLYYAVSYSPTGATAPALGAVKLEANTSVALDARLVNFTDAKIAEAHFPSLPNDQLKELVAELVKLVPAGAMVMGLDRVLARFDKSQIIPKNVADVKADPPVIFYSTSAAVLVNLDGDPIWSPIKGNDLKFAVNTNWDLFQSADGNALFLRYETGWLTASSIRGPWKPAGTLPAGLKTLPDDNDNWTDVKKAVPGVALKSSAVPKIFVSTTPAELILLHGEPNYLLVPNTKLLWVSNTDSDVFRLGKGGPVYFLISGRWFTAADFSGPWTFATQSLPEDFAKIPLSHERSRVLASVPGTDQAAEAVLLAQIPQTATVNKKTIKAPDVQYDGAPKFDPIEKTSLSRAVNTDKDIIKVGDLYYMCFQGVWFMGKSPTGPWEATGSVPGAIYEIPASSPVHNVTYVTVQEDTDDTAVYVAAAAYTGMMIAWGCVVWGSGYYYPPYIGYGGFYPAYYPYYRSYGYHASYNPWTGAYGRGFSAYGPYGGAGVGARYNPSTGTYSRGAVAYGPGGARGAATAYNPRTGTSAATRQGSNVYGSWGQTAVQRGDQWASTSRVTNRATGNTTRVTQGSNGGAAITRNTPGPGGGGVARTGSGDVYAGRDGNVYRKDAGGGWSQSDGNGGWNNVDTPSPRGDATQRGTEARDRASSGTNRPDNSTIGQLNRDSAARAEGKSRTNAYGSSGGRTGGSSYRPSGGGGRAAPRGGGGRRR